MGLGRYLLPGRPLGEMGTGLDWPAERPERTPDHQIRSVTAPGNGAATLLSASEVGW